MWISCAKHGRLHWRSLSLGLMERSRQFKRWFAPSPLTLTLSPLRGEGTAIARFCDGLSARKESPITNHAS
jgi:hypothetical protein